LASSISKTTISTLKAVNPPENIMNAEEEKEAERQIAAVLDFHSAVEKKSLIMIITSKYFLRLQLSSLLI
jgi:hypothetical protein